MSEMMQPSALLAAIVQSSDDAIVSKNLDGVIQSWNPAAERMFGFTAAEAVGRPITMIIPPDRLDEEIEVLTRVRNGQCVDHFETVRRRKDGRLLNISLSVSPIRTSDGTIVGASKIARDITEQKRAADRLEDEMRIVETLNRVGATLAATLDHDKVVEAVADAARQLTNAAFGVFCSSRAGTAGAAHTLSNLSDPSPDSFVQFLNARAPELCAGTCHGRGVVRLDDVTGDPRFKETTPSSGMPAGDLSVRSYLAVPVVAGSGEVLGGLFFGHPWPGVFTERHERVAVGIAGWAAVALENARLYQQAQHANRVKDEFLATVSHELRTPLNAILGWAQILRSTAADEAGKARAIETIQRNARLQAQLIEDLLDVSRIVAGKLSLRREDVDLAAVVAAAVEDVRPSAAAKGIELHAAISAESSGVVGDPARLQQIVWNFLSNAVKFTPRGGRVDVALESVNGQAQITVKDTGQGIAPEFLPHVFERFRQADVSTRRYGGLGLGLAIVKHLTEAQGGRVEVSSAGQGQGATFTVRLPLRPDAKPPMRGARDVKVASTIAQLSGVRVLVVDDEQDAADLLAFTLAERGAQVTIASSAKEALAAVSQHLFDVLLADIGMPDMNGYDLIRAIRTLDPRQNGERLTAVAVTALASEEDRQTALAAGFDWHLGKPVDPERIAELVGQAAAPGDVE